jgi:hypothetical protein
MHGIRAQQGQDARKEKPPMPAEKWPDVLPEPGDGVPRKSSDQRTMEKAFCNATVKFARFS